MRNIFDVCDNLNKFLNKQIDKYELFLIILMCISMFLMTTSVFFKFFEVSIIFLLIFACCAFVLSVRKISIFLMFLLISPYVAFYFLMLFITSPFFIIYPINPFIVFCIFWFLVWAFLSLTVDADIAKAVNNIVVRLSASITIICGAIFYFYQDFVAKYFDTNTDFAKIIGISIGIYTLPALLTLALLEYAVYRKNKKPNKKFSIQALKLEIKTLHEDFKKMRDKFK